MTKIKIAAPAKINLFLDVTGRLENGYHTIDTVMQSVSLCDYITITLTGTSGNAISLVCTENALPLDENNLAHRAADAFFKRADNIDRQNLEIVIEKHIPIAAGLAGGSTDAAGVLIALNLLYGERFSCEELCDIALPLGADIPFCVRGGTVRCGGIGEIFTSCRPMPGLFIVIAIGDDAVNTAWAYSQLDADAERLPHKNTVHAALESGDIDALCAGLYNVFENVVSSHEPLKKLMRESGAAGTLMSGSGPSVFGLFYDPLSAHTAYEALTENGYRAFLAKPC